MHRTGPLLIGVIKLEEIRSEINERNPCRTLTFRLADTGVVYAGKTIASIGLVVVLLIRVFLVFIN